VFYLFDIEKFNNLPQIRKKAIQFYIQRLSSKPIFAIIFGSTAKGVFKDDSDLDMVVVFNEPNDTKQATKYSESQTGIKIHDIIMSFDDFVKEIKLEEDSVIQSALETGFIAYNHMYYYEVIGNARYDLKKNVNRQGVFTK
jgi:predicted nucleotidyltransferase